MEQDQSFFLFCCPEQYSISFPNHLLSSDSDYFVSYTYPDGTTKESSAQLAGTGVLLSQSPEHDHPCTVNVALHARSQELTEDVTEFSLDLVSPVEYLFRKFSANEFEMTDKISDKMTSALLAMSLSYYYVMGEHVEKEERVDEILSTLLNCSKDMAQISTEKAKGNISEDSITKFAQQYKLQNTLQYLSGGVSVGDLPVQLPKPLCPSDGEAPEKNLDIVSQPKSDSLPTSKNIYNVPNNKPLPEPIELDQEDYEIIEPPPRPPKPDALTGEAPMKEPAVNSNNSLPTSNNVYNVPNNKPLLKHPPVELDQEEYVITDPPPRPPKPDPVSATNGPVSQPTSDSQATNNNVYNVPNNKPLPKSPPVVLDTEEYVITDPPPESPNVRYVEEPTKSLKSTGSLSSIQTPGQSPTTFKPPTALPRVNSAVVTGKMVIGEVYEMCDSTPAELAAEKAVKNRGPPPKIPAPYQRTQSLDRFAKHGVSSSRKESSSSESSPASPLQEASSPSVLKPPPRRKFSIHKPKTNKQST